MYRKTKKQSKEPFVSRREKVKRYNRKHDTN